MCQSREAVTVIVTITSHIKLKTGAKCYKWFNLLIRLNVSSYRISREFIPEQPCHGQPTPGLDTAGLATPEAPRHSPVRKKESSELAGGQEVLSCLSTAVFPALEQCLAHSRCSLIVRELMKVWR